MLSRTNTDFTAYIAIVHGARLGKQRPGAPSLPQARAVIGVSNMGCCSDSLVHSAPCPAVIVHAPGMLIGTVD
jgi:hypothetical protein